MKIAVLGSGAMGGVYGYKLFQGGYDVTLVDIWKEHVAAIRANRLKVDGYGEGEYFKTKCTELEAAAVAKAKGIFMDYDPWESARKVMTDTVRGRASMLQDVMARRRTEIDVINGAIVREGLSLGIPTPVNQVLTGLVTVIQQTYHED